MYLHISLFFLSFRQAPLSLVRTLEDYLNSPDFEEGQQAATKQKEVAVSAAKPTSKPAAAKSPSSTPSNTNGNSNSAKFGNDGTCQILLSTPFALQPHFIFFF